MTYPLPRDTQVILTQAIAQNKERWQECRNIGLVFDRFTVYKSKDWQLEGGEKKDILQNIEDLAQVMRTGNDQHSRDYRALIEAMQARQSAQAATLKASGCEVWRRQLDLENRLIVGLGRKAALEVGFGTHWLYGVPTIPGSALKGLARMWAFWELAVSLGVQPMLYRDRQQCKEADKRFKTPAERLDDLLSMPIGAQDDETRLQWLAKRKEVLPDQTGDVMAEVEKFQAVFGTQKHGGGIIFFDAIPTCPPQIRVDVMNPHYGDYYQDQTCHVPPADWLSPKPVYFLVVEKTPFSFALAARTPHCADLIETAQAWLVNALTDLGAGGKTSAGYGYFVGGALQPVAVQPALPTPPAPVAAPALETPARPLEWKRGKVKGVKAGKSGEITPDGEPEKTMRFWQRDVVDKGWSPGVRAIVEYAVRSELDGKQVVLVRKPRSKTSIVNLT